MSTPVYSGTYSFAYTAQQCVTDAFVLTGAFDEYETIPPADYAYGLQALEVMVKEMALDGMPLWCIQDISFPTVVGQATYNLSQITGTTLPIRVLDQYIVDQAGNSVTLVMTSRYDWNTLGQKFAQGVPNQVWYNPQLEQGILTLYDVPSDATHTIHVVVQLQMQDVGALTNNMAFPQEAFRMLKWCLADEISLPYRCPADERKEINQKAIGFRNKFFNAEFGQEQASIYLTPSERGVRN
jgi:hypothetical protein